jgi:hypothetical protein
MKRLSVALILLAVYLCPQWLMASGDLTGAKWVPGRLLVNFKETTGPLYDVDGKNTIVKIGVPSVDFLLSRYQVTSMLRVVDDATLSMLKLPPDLFRYMILMCPENTDVPKMMEDFDADPNVESAFPDILYDMLDRTPNDPYWSGQWDKRLMNTPLVWQYTTGSDSMIMVAIDGGTWWKHQDLYDNLWVNPGEDITENGLAYTDTTYPGDQEDIDGTDNDVDGKIDDFLGWDFVRSISGCAQGEDCDSQMDNNTISLSDHGTHVIGLMAARGNNEIGVAGQNWHAKIISCRAGYLNNQGDGLIVSSAAVAAMTWAVGKGARVLNMSYGSSASNPTEASTITTLYNQGVIFVGAAGNNGNTVRNYPGAGANVVCVGSVDEGNYVSDFSNRGTWVDVFAPGGNVLSLTLEDGYINLSGTSMASPNTAGMFALLWTLFPEYTNTELINFVLDHCRDITGLNPGIPANQLGRGAIDAELILQSVFPQITLESSAFAGDNDGDGRLESNETATLSLAVHNDEAWMTAYNVIVQVSTTDPTLTLTNSTFEVAELESGVSANNNNSPVQIQVGTVAEAHWATINVHISSLDVPRYFADQSITVRVGRPQTLLVADDGPETYQDYFSSGLMDSSGSGFNHDIWDVPSKGDPTWADVSEYGYMVWVCGLQSTNTINASNQVLLAQWLNAGKDLLVAGQNIQEDISASVFYSDYLHAQSATGTGRPRAFGVVADPIADGQRLILIGGACAGNGQISPSVINPVNGGLPVFYYDSTMTTCGAVRYSDQTYKMVYFAFGIESACGAGGTAHYSTILRNAMRWFGANEVSDVDPTHPATIPAGFALHANYPNPFNPSTIVSYDLPRSSTVILRVYDLLGRQVAELVNGRVDAGSHMAVFNGTDLPSGTYIARIQAEGFSASQKMMLIK